MADEKLALKVPQQQHVLEGQGHPGARPQDQAIRISFGPPMTELSAQDPSTGFRLAGAPDLKPKRLILKHTHLSSVDYRIFDPLIGQVVCVSHSLAAIRTSPLTPIAPQFGRAQHTLW